MLPFAPMGRQMICSGRVGRGTPPSACPCFIGARARALSSAGLGGWREAGIP